MIGRGARAEPLLDGPGLPRRDLVGLAEQAIALQRRPQLARLELQLRFLQLERTLARQSALELDHRVECAGLVLGPESCVRQALQSRC